MILWVQWQLYQQQRQQQYYRTGLHSEFWIPKDVEREVLLVSHLIKRTPPAHEYDGPDRSETSSCDGDYGDGRLDIT